MHEKERHRIILSAVQDRPVVTVVELCGSDRRVRGNDPPGHCALCMFSIKLRRVRGGAEAISPPQFVGLAGRTFAVNETMKIREKRAIAQAAVELCEDGDADYHQRWYDYFSNGPSACLAPLPGFHQFFSDCRALLKHSKNTIMLSGGTIYREQNIILSPFDNDVTRNFCARRMFMGAQGLGPLGLMEADPLLIQAEQKLIGQADELVVLVDSSKFENRSSLVLCPLDRIDTVITDEGISDRAAAMLEAADVKLIVADTGAGQRKDEAAS